MNFQIAIIISAFGLCMTMPIFVRYFAYANFPLLVKCMAFLFCIMIALAPICVSRELTSFYGATFRIMEYACYFVYILALILFVFTLIRDIFWIVGHLSKLLPSPFDPIIFTKVNFITIFFALVCTAWSLYEGVKVPDEKHVFISSPKITQSKTVVLLSDLHMNRTLSPAKIQKIVAKTNELKPDLIGLVGDIIDDDVTMIQSHINLLGDLKARQGVYFVSGNHEFYVGYQKAMKALKDVGFISAENQSIEIDPNFYVAGVSDLHTTQRLGISNNNRVQQILENTPQTAYILLLSHSPTPMDIPFDLQVSGHTHGGQIFPFHFFSWWGNHHLLAGLYPTEKIYVSRGAGQWGPQMRFGAPAEITVLHLINQK